MSIRSTIAPTRRIKVPASVKDSGEGQDRGQGAPTRTNPTFFEVNFDYIISDADQDKYTVETYFFIPSRLKINEKTYTKEDFFSELENYVRFQTPRIALSGINNLENQYSPLNKLDRQLESLLNGNQDHAYTERAVYELKLLASIMKSNLRNQATAIIKNLQDETRRSAATTILATLLGDLVQLRAHLLDFERKIYVSQVPTEVQETFDVAREYISWMVEKNLARVYQVLHEVEKHRDLADEVATTILEEQKFRRDQKSKLVFKNKKENEGFTYWYGMYKKYLASVLYLNIDESNEQSKIINLLYAIAAGVAMFFSIYLGYLVTLRVEAETAVYFFLLIAIYMLKDRVKELLRLHSGTLLSHYLSDRKFYIVDAASQERIGSSRESLQYIPRAEISSTIQNIRGIGTRSNLEKRMKPEIVLKYTRKIRLFPKKIMEVHTRHRHVHDVLRFSIRNFLTFCDSPYVKKQVLDPETSRVKTIFSAKVYHLNVVQKMTAKSENGARITKLQRLRVVFDKNGIKRVEKVGI